MNAAYLVIEWPQLALSALFLLVAGALSWRYRLGLEKDLAVGGLRCVVQLMVMGYLLHIIFGLQSAVLVVLMLLIMGTFATRIVGGRVKERSVPFFWPTFWAMQGSFFLVTIIVSRGIIGAEPWWQPQYVIPIGGMVAGNAMNSLALALDRFLADLTRRRNEVELRLCLGANPEEASRDIFRDALRTGMIPSINSLMGVGLVALPGMMTGQILAGASPEDAVRYQVVVMLMLVATTALVSFIALTLVRRRCFGQAMQLVIKRGA